VGCPTENGLHSRVLHVHETFFSRGVGLALGANAGLDYLPYKFHIYLIFLNLYCVLKQISECTLVTICSGGQGMAAICWAGRKRQ
jgi:hypothetical protein